MSRITTIRTTAFRLSADLFGHVYVYRAGLRFARAWQNLERSRRPPGDPAAFNSSPYHGLAIALRILTGDFVSIKHWMRSDERQAPVDQAIIITRRPIPHTDLTTAVIAWESRALKRSDSPIAQVLDDLYCEEVRVADLISTRPGLCPSFSERWAWNAGVWEAAHRLSAHAMETDHGPLCLRLDSEATLLTWDDLVQNQKRNAAAMHRLRLKLMTIPGVEEPVLSIQSGLVRLAPTWRAANGARYAWAAMNETSPILRAEVRPVRTADGGYDMKWNDCAAEVLQGASLDPLPCVSNEPTFTGSLRTGYAKQPSRHPIGKGSGPWFDEYVAHHARRMLGNVAHPVVLSACKIPNGWREKSARVSLKLDAQPQLPLQLQILVIYAGASIRRRVRDGILSVLKEDAHSSDLEALREFADRLPGIDDGIPLRLGPIEISFIRPHEALKGLTQRQSYEAIKRWLDAFWPQVDKNRGAALAAIIETDVQAADKPQQPDGLADPKQVLRRQLAAKGVVTQFIAQASAGATTQDGKDMGHPDEPQDHAAANAVKDLLRSAGFFLKPFPEFGCGNGTIVVGVYGVRPTKIKWKRRSAAYVVNLVAVSLGTCDAWGFVDEQGWIPIAQATARFLATDQEDSEIEAKQKAERAIEQLAVRFGEHPVVLLFDACGCRRFWRCLTNESDQVPDHWMVGENRAVVRVRAEPSELVRPAGVGEWSDRFMPAKHTPFRLMSLGDRQSVTPTYLISGSSVMDRERSARESTRMATSPHGLRKDWHSLGVTELHVLAPGPFEPETLLRQIGLLCRVAPSWDRTLRWPSPLHLARAIVRDHPKGYLDDAEEDTDIEEP